MPVKDVVVTRGVVCLSTRVSVGASPITLLSLVLLALLWVRGGSTMLV